MNTKAKIIITICFLSFLSQFASSRVVWGAQQANIDQISAEIYKITETKVAKRAEELTYFLVRNEKSGILVRGLELPGQECLVCAEKGAYFKTKPKKTGDEYVKKIKGPKVGMLSDLYLSDGEISQPYTQTEVKAYEGAVTVSSIVKVGDQEIVLPPVVLQGQMARGELPPAEEVGPKSRKALFNRKPTKPAYGVVKVSPCGYVTYGERGPQLRKPPALKILP